MRALGASASFSEEGTVILCKSAIIDWEAQERIEEEDKASGPSVDRRISRSRREHCSIRKDAVWRQLKSERNLRRRDGGRERGVALLMWVNDEDSGVLS